MTFTPGMPTPAAQPLVRLEQAMEDWRRTAIGAQPMANADYVRTVCEEIVRRAEILAQQSTLRFEDVSAFLLTRTRAWVLGGLPIAKIGGKLPKTLNDLGMLKLVEGGNNGGPMTAAEIKSINTRKRIIQ